MEPARFDSLCTSFVWRMRFLLGRRTCVDKTLLFSVVLYHQGYAMLCEIGLGVHSSSLLQKTTTESQFRFEWSWRSHFRVDKSLFAWQFRSYFITTRLCHARLGLGSIFFFASAQNDDDREPSTSTRCPVGADRRFGIWRNVLLTAVRVDSREFTRGFIVIDLTQAYAHQHGVTLPHPLEYLEGWKDSDGLVVATTLGGYLDYTFAYLHPWPPIRWDKFD
jgi:hypothetical protein